MSYSSPQPGRLYLRSHGDCFIHATQWWIKYWNVSVTKDGLAIVRVTVVSSGTVFLATLCPASIPYENVQKGVKRKLYLEIDPKFAVEVGVAPGAEVVVESVGEVERCRKIVIAPVLPSDYDKLEKFSEKIDYELAERIRVVSCHYSFPIWIDNLVLSARVVSTEPSAAWVLLVPNETMVQLQGDDGSPLPSSSSVQSTPGTRGSSSSTPPSTETSTVSTLSPPPASNTGRKHWDFDNQYTHYRPNRKKSATSSGSSVDTSPTSEEDHFSLSFAATSLFRNTVGKLFSREPSQEGGNGRSLVGSLDSVGFETNCLPGAATPALEPRSQELLVTKQPRQQVTSQHKKLMNEIKARSSTPEQPSPSTSDPTANVSRSHHKRYNTWHSGSDFFNHRPRGRTPAPRINTNLRVQPHTLTGIHSSYDAGYWSHERLFDVFIHPSTLPEVFNYWQKSNENSFLVEVTPTHHTPSPSEGSKADDGAEGKGETSSGLLPTSLVVRLCFATRLRLVDEELVGRMEEVGIASDIVVRGGHLVMSDALRQQLAVKTCTRVTVQHVKDEWRIPFSDKPSLLLQPLRPQDKHRSVSIKCALEDWIRGVSQRCPLGVVLVDKQIIPVLQDEDGEWVCVRVKVNSSVRRSSRIRVSYLVVTPAQVEAHRLSLHIDNLPRNNSGGLLARPVLSRLQRESSPSREVPITLPSMDSLNQPHISEDIEQFKALEVLYKQGVEFIGSILAQRTRGALLICGVSGAGGSGCGKSTLARLLCKAAGGWVHQTSVTMLDCTTLRGLTMHNFKKRLKRLFKEAESNQPSVILLDDLDHTMPNVADAQEQIGEEGTASIRRTQVLLDLMERGHGSLVVIATSQNKQELNSELLLSRGSHVFGLILEINSPSLADRKLILDSILTAKAVEGFSDEDLRFIALKTEGFQPGDLVTLVDRAISLAELRTLYPNHTPKFQLQGRSNDSELELSSSPVKKSPIKLVSSPQFSTPPSSPRKRPPAFDFKKKGLTHKKISVVSTDSTHTLIPEESIVGGTKLVHSASLSQMRLGVVDFTAALKGFVPVSLRGLPLHKSGNIDFSGVGGLTSVKQTLRETLLWPSKYPRLFAQCPIKQRCGVLLYGPPGTGKTMLAGAVAKEFSLNFVSIKGPELLSKYIGASEQAVRDVFTRALCAKPCILFFDEFDSLAPRRGHDNTGVTDRVVNQLLTQLDGVEALQGVYVLAATSRPDLIDSALLRPGRIDRAIHCDMPTKDERHKILIALSSDMHLAHDADLGGVAALMEGMTGADIKAILYSAQLAAAHETLSRDESMAGLNEREALDSPGSPTSSRRPLVFSCSTGQAQKSKPNKTLESTTRALLRRSPNQQLSRRRSTLTTESEKRKSSVKISQQHLLAAVQEVTPSVSTRELKKFNQIYDRFTGKSKVSLENIKPTVTMA